MYRLVVRIGGAAAAIASIAGVLLSLSHLVWRDSAPIVPVRVSIAKPDVHVTYFRDYLKEHGRSTKGVPHADLMAKVIAVDYRVTVAHGAPKTAYPLRLTLLKSRNGVFTTVDQKTGARLDTGIDPGTDRTIGDAAFDRLAGPGLYRLRIDVVSSAKPSNVLESRPIDVRYP